jgi:nucleotide sugar dehydrogenase
MSMTKDRASVCVVGLGKLGLPLALQFASNGIETWGFDIDSVKVSSLVSGVSEFDEPDLTSRLRDLVDMNLFTPTNDLSKAVSGASHIVVVVPLDIDLANKPDFAKLDSATSEIGKVLKVGQTVVVETTVPVGTTRERLTPLLEKNSGLKAGVDFCVAFSPERVSSGSMKQGFARYPKLIGGITKECAVAAVLYKEGFNFEQNPALNREVGVWVMGSSEAAEFAKLAETTYRDVNLALANTFAMASMRHGIDYLEIVEACNSQPFSHLHTPGISIGGHCIPVYPHLFLESNDGMGLIEMARKVNESMPERMVQVSQAHSPSPAGSNALIIGLAYRTGVRESAHSGAFQIKESLEKIHVVTHLADELFSDEEILKEGFLLLPNLQKIDLVFINSGDESYIRQLLDTIGGTPLIVDGRRTLTSNPPKRYIAL